MPRIQSNSETGRPIVSVRKFASRDQDFSEALASKGDKPVPADRPIPTSARPEGPLHHRADGTALLSKMHAKSSISAAALGTEAYSRNLDFTTAEPLPAPNDVSGAGPSGRFVHSTIWPPIGQLPVTGGDTEFAPASGITRGGPDLHEGYTGEPLFAASKVAAAESLDRIVDQVASSSDTNPLSTDGNADFPGANATMVSRFGLIDVGDAQISEASPMHPNASNALLGLPTASASQSVTWSRVFGQHLIANEYLSVVNVVGREHRESEAPWASVEAHEGRIEVDDALSSTPPSATQPDQVSDTQTEEAEKTHPAMESDINDGGPPTLPDAPLVALEAALATDHHWNKRVLKLTHDPVGTCTAWVRDFGLYESEMQTLAVSLRHQAAMQGVPLGRIVINGHELWRARD